MSTAQVQAIIERRWALIDDMCTTPADIKEFEASKAWQDYLKHKEEVCD